jgi:peptidoglycan/xylan/chitin deacetylase (PgdA/CDA1 family)
MMLLGLLSFSLVKGYLTFDEPSALLRRQLAVPTVTPFGSCGTVAGNCSVGLCCSKDNLCGSTTAECGPGCQAGFGKCGSTSSTPLPADVITECNRPGVFALTYDDGVSEYTASLLDILKKNNVTATFFINGMNTGDITAEPRKSVLSRMYSEGHQVASHTNTHADLLNLTAEGITQEMELCDKAIQSVIGVRPTYMRPPFGNFNELVLSTLKSLGFKIIIWNADTSDFEHPLDPNFVALNQAGYDKTMLGKTSATSSFISLQHDIVARTVSEWTQVAIDKIRSQNYTFVTVGDCIGEAENLWYRSPIPGFPVGITPTRASTVPIAVPTSKTPIPTIVPPKPSVASLKSSESKLSHSLLLSLLILMTFFV